jgi:predicted AAA+ superfamily ATPase
MRFKLLSMLKTHYEAYNPMKVVIFFVQEVMPKCFRANYLPTYQAVMLSLGYIVYLINKVQRMNVKGLKKFEIGEKYYFEDLGLRNCKQHLDYSTDINKLMENAVFQHLKMLNYQVYVGKMGDLEIDFIGIKDKRKIYIQVAYLIADEKTKEREFGNLLKIDNNYRKYVITLDSFSSGTNYQGIEHIHLRDFLKRSEL